MKKLFFVAAVAMMVSGAFAAPANTKAVIASDWFAYEAMWIAGGAGYQEAVYRAAEVYAKKMDKHCKASVMAVDISPAIKAYRVFVPRGAESIRDGLVRKQIATLACITQHGETYAAKEQLV